MALLNLVALPVDYSMTWKEAQEYAEEKAGGLPTSNDLKLSSVNVEKEFWMPVNRADGIENDFCLIGSYPDVDAYDTYVNKWGTQDKDHYTMNGTSYAARPGPFANGYKGIIFALKGEY